MSDDGAVESDRGVGLSGLAHAESADQVTARYDDWANGYDADLARWGYRVPAELARRLVEASDASPAWPPGPVLDAGCGTGLVGAAIRHAFAARQAPCPTLIGIDLSGHSLQVASSRIFGGPPVYRATSLADLSAPLGFAAGSMSGVVCGGVLTYLPEPEPVLAEFVRVTAPGGVVLATQRTDLWVERDGDAVLERLARSSGCAVSVSDPEPYLPGATEYGDHILVRYIELAVPA